MCTTLSLFWHSIHDHDVRWNWKKNLQRAVLYNDLAKIDELLNTEEVQRELPRITAWTFDQNPLHAAAAYGHIDAIKIMVNKNVPINSMTKYTNGDYCTALQVAIYWKQIGSIRSLLEIGADTSSEGDITVDYVRGNYSGTCWDWLKIQNDAKVTRAFEEAYVSYSANNGWKNELCLKVIHDEIEQMEQILSQQEVKKDIQTINEWVVGPLHLAASRGQLGMIDKLLQAGVRINALNGVKNTPLNQATQWSQLDSVKILLWNGALVNYQNVNGRTALHEAFNLQKSHNMIMLIDTLLSNEADINVRDKFGHRPVDDEGGTELLLELIGAKVEFNHILISFRQDNLYTSCLKNDLPSFKDCIKQLSPKDAFSEKRPYSHLWNACNNGNLDMIKIILKMKPGQLRSKAPDGTTPYLMASLRNYEDIIGFFHENRLIENPYETVCDIYGDSLMTYFTLKYPVFNDAIEGKVKVKAPKEASEFTQFVLSNLCPIISARRGLQGSKDQIMYVNKIPLEPCKWLCGNENYCLMVKDMVYFVQEIEKRFTQKAPRLRPVFILVGSIAEGTRIGSATELDVTWKFDLADEHHLRVADDGYSLKITSEEEEEEEHPLRQFCDDGGNVLNFETFFTFLLQTLDEIISELTEKVKAATEGRIQFQSGCQKCCPYKVHDEVKGNFYTHCKTCIFNLTQTKSGACLIFKWRKWLESQILTVDLIPVLPVANANVMGLFNLAIKTLVEDKPANWFKYARGIVTQDSVLPQSYCRKVARDLDEPIQVGFKLISYTEGRNNFLIKPAQILGITEHVGNGFMMKVFATIKCIKSAFKVDVKSYLIKKILLTDEMQGKINRNGEKHWEKSVFEVLQHVELKKQFERSADYQKWKKSLKV